MIIFLLICTNIYESDFGDNSVVELVCTTHTPLFPVGAEIMLIAQPAQLIVHLMCPICCLVKYAQFVVELNVPHLQAGNF